MKFERFYSGADVRFYVENLERIERLVQFKAEVEASLPMSIAKTVCSALRALANDLGSTSPLQGVQFDPFEAQGETYILLWRPDFWDDGKERGLQIGITNFSLRSLKRGSSEPLRLVVWSHSPIERERLRWEREIRAMAVRVAARIRKIGGRAAESGQEYPIEIPLPSMNLWQLGVNPDAAMEEIWVRAEGLLTALEEPLSEGLLGLKAGAAAPAVVRGKRVPSR